jgi:Nickel responsive protein SCO4226-like
MTEYLVELYLPKAGADDGLHDAVVRARVAADETARDGAVVQFLRSIFIPDDETCFLLFEATSPDAVADVTRRAGMDLARITEAVDGGPAA